MPALITYGNELLRINPAKGIEYSADNGYNWRLRLPNMPNLGTYKDLLVYGSEILMVTSKGLCYSKDKAYNFHFRRFVDNMFGDFISLAENGNELIINTTKGLHYSTDGGYNLRKRF